MQLASIRSENGIYGLLALDEMPQLAELMELNLNEPADQQALAGLSDLLMKNLSAEASGVVVSPEFSFNSIIQKSHSTGLLLALEQRRTDADPLAIPQLVENWGPEHVKNNYSLCKLELYYHPQEKYALKKQQLVAEVYDYCKYLGIDFLLDLKRFNLAQEETADQQQESTIWAVEEFRTLCHILAIDLPEDPLAAVTVTAELDIPWVLHAGDIKYDSFKEKLRLALESGAAGFMVGQALWAELPEPVMDEQNGGYNLDNAAEFIKTTVRDRLIELMRIAGENRL